MRGEREGMGQGGEWDRKEGDEEGRDKRGKAHLQPVLRVARVQSHLGDV